MITMNTPVVVVSKRVFAALVEDAQEEYQYATFDVAPLQPIPDRTFYFSGVLFVEADK